MRTLLILGILIGLIGCDRTPLKTIYVSGTGEIEVVPDMAYLNVNSSSTMKTAKQSYAATSEAINAMIDECKKLGIEKEDIKTSHISIDKQYQWIKNTQTFMGYYSSAYLKITVRNLDILGELSEKVLETKTNEINGINYDHSKYDSLYNEAGVVALKNAKNIADRMAKEMGVAIGQILRISNEKNTETDAVGYGAGYLAMNAFDKRKRETKTVQVEPGIIKIPNTSYVTFEIN